MNRFSTALTLSLLATQALAATFCVYEGHNSNGGVSLLLSIN